MHPFRPIAFAVLCLTFAASGFAQYTPMTYRTLTVPDGLPQSYVSGIVQDPQGFMWIGTRDGLARYDGRQFKVFRHDGDDSTTLASNITRKLTLDRDGLLWIGYEEGELDILNTRTEEIIHCSAEVPYAALKHSIKMDGPIVQDRSGKHWMLSKDGALFVVDLHEKQLTRHTATSLFPQFDEHYITGLARVGDDMLLMLDRSMAYINGDMQVRERVMFDFANNRLYNPTVDWKDTSPLVRSNGDMLFADQGRLVFFEKAKAAFTVFRLPVKQYFIMPRLLMGKDENIIVAYRNYSYYFYRATNQLVLVDTMASNQYVKTALCVDRSGVLWEGSNGFGIRQFDVYLRHMPSQAYQIDFPFEVLHHLGIAQEAVDRTFLRGINAYFFRWVNGRDGQIWMAKAGEDSVRTPNLLRYHDGILRQEHFVYHNLSPQPNQGIDALAVDPGGDLWGLDHRFRLIRFDEATDTATVYPPLALGYLKDRFNEINGMVADGDNTFWICSARGLIRYHLRTGSVAHFIEDKRAVHLLAIQQDPRDPDILWLGTYSDGLIRFDKRTGSYRFFKARDGLPNHTVYTIIPDARGVLWCSSNKGIFSFNPETYQVHGYIPQGNTPLVECNRFHCFVFPDGKLLFGGTGVYTRFAPSDMRDDHFEPNTALTGIFINNKPAHYGNPEFPLDRPINALQRLRVPYHQNFLSFEFAALQFNAPEKLQYRYKLEGFDTDWVLAGNKNVATYTGVPPGEYTLLINASNTSGKWSSHIKELPIIITPPFWKTWWFITLSVLASGILVFLLVRQQLRAIRKKDQARMAYERETMELEARALRSQMNPHFVFNCLSSIKSLIQQGEKRAAVAYLTTFSKLIRNQLSNTQKEISLQEELDTCLLYVQLEALRFGDKLSCLFEADPHVNLAALKVPPLIIQPFVENAIVHGILPKAGNGSVAITVQQQGDNVVCRIDDNGIGREQAALLKSKRKARHESKGTLLATHRLKLHNTLSRHNIDITIDDKLDENRLAAGTCVSLLFKLQP
ncbi:sensor histidine kinase [Parapedobacter koreensis]|uniref:Two component regulator propeller n=1 Tax=Parapedobacter koreensis TaxID=332977 RepID=A0A1H7TJF4_9SPHI|nr:histidine kinase [Parapedobacter koreensis]SEL85022.1 Two component regulator propeller [Parapedobacter koreensis]